MYNCRLLLIIGLVVAVPVSGQPTSQNKIGPGFVPANIYDALEPGKERQIFDERPHIRDFRKAPKVPESLMLPLEKSRQSDPVNDHNADKRARDLLRIKEYSAAQQEFEKLLQSNKTAVNYAGLAESLAMQNKVHEADVVLREARAHDFASDANVAAVNGHVFYLHANEASYNKYELYMAAAISCCKGALAVDPHNQIALATLERVRSKRLEKAKEFEENGDLVLAQLEYEIVLKEKKDDADAKSALANLKLRRERYEQQAKEPISKTKLFRGDFKEIPAQTKVPIIFDTPVNSDTSKPGDNFSVRTLEPIAEADGYVVLPAGAVIKGTVTRASEWTSDQHILKDGKMELRFDSIEALGFASTSLVAKLVSHGGVIQSTRNSENISYDTSMQDSRTVVTTFLAKKGKIIDVRIGDQFKLSFPDGLRVFRR